MRLSDPEFNRLSVLKKLRLEEPVSRTELARLTGLNGGTITTITRDLMARGLVVEAPAASQGGRPKMNLRINPDGAFAVGATLTPDGRLITETVNLRGEIVFSLSERMVHTSRLEDLAGQVGAIVKRAVSEGPAAQAISQVGVGLPAIVDTRRGVVEFLEMFEEKAFPFGERVEALVGIPTGIDNNVNLLARAEHWFGEGTGIDDFTIVIVDLGIGAASYQGGQLHLSSHGIEAELGHMKIMPENGRPCHCGDHGCLQAYSSMSGIVEQYWTATGGEALAILDMQDRFTDIATRAQAGDEVAQGLFVRAGRLLGTAIANHINMQGPERIVVLFNDPRLRERLSGPLLEAVERDTFPFLRGLTDVKFGEVDEGRYARGAAAMVLERLYQAR